MEKYINVVTLNEMETAELLEKLSCHIEKNGWVHLFNQIDYVTHLEEVITELKLFKEKSENIKTKIEQAIQQIDKVTIQLMKSAE